MSPRYVDDQSAPIDTIGSLQTATGSVPFTPQPSDRLQLTEYKAGSVAGCRNYGILVMISCEQRDQRGEDGETRPCTVIRGYLAPGKGYENEEREVDLDAYCVGIEDLVNQPVFGHIMVEATRELERQSKFPQSFNANTPELAAGTQLATFLRSMHLKDDTIYKPSAEAQFYGVYSGFKKRLDDGTSDPSQHPGGQDTNCELHRLTQRDYAGLMMPVVTALNYERPVTHSNVLFENPDGIQFTIQQGSCLGHPMEARIPTDQPEIWPKENVKGEQPRRGGYKRLRTRVITDEGPLNSHPDPPGSKPPQRPRRYHPTGTSHRRPTGTSDSLQLSHQQDPSASVDPLGYPGSTTVPAPDDGSGASFGGFGDMVSSPRSYQTAFAAQNIPPSSLTDLNVQNVGRVWSPANTIPQSTAHFFDHATDSGLAYFPAFHPNGNPTRPTDHIFEIPYVESDHQYPVQTTEPDLSYPFSVPPNPMQWPHPMSAEDPAWTAHTEDLSRQSHEPRSTRQPELMERKGRRTHEGQNQPYHSP
jgi:hypothetical protein